MLFPRNFSLISGNKNLEHLFTFKDFPVFMGCTDGSVDKDLKADMSFSIDPETGLIQLDKVLPLEVVYQNPHCDGIGKTWQDHYIAFSHFLEKFNPKSVLEIGGANDFIVNDYLNRNPETKWTIVEPHPLFQENDKVKIIKQWFDDSFSLDSTKVDTVVHSHVLEHTYDPTSFIKHISKFLKPGEKHIFTLPNMVEQLSRKYTNCLNFEHTVFLAEPFVDHILKTNGYEIIAKEYYQDHSIFYSTVRTNLASSQTSPPQKYSEYKKLFTDFISYHQQLVHGLNIKLDQFDGDIFLFGAHIFSQYLLEFGLDKNKIKNVLDNSDLKNEKRLYGTNLIVKKPEIIRNLKKVAVILKIGAYRDEVVKQLKEINPKVIILE